MAYLCGGRAKTRGGTLRHINQERSRVLISYQTECPIRTKCPMHYARAQEPCQTAQVARCYITSTFGSAKAAKGAWLSHGADIVTVRFRLT